ncbi:YueI family protein [Oceanobacillus sp. Castelsardo]|uniref:YueI family protein n=1 Tax=Oceanobacillus sp. Castelsardo TaxID=1851204 RepID=UPI000839A39A|nr:YueI family protein [Oceanobacillus sp. Castelsardo]
MSSKEVNDYLTEGMYGTRLPKEEERKKYLGTLRERIVLALTVGQVMSDKGINKLEEAMKANKGAKLLINGHVSTRFMTEEKALANKYNIPYTIITDETNETDIGAVLTFDYAVDKKDIFIKDTQEEDESNKVEKNNSLFSKVKNLFK